jgi:sortase A
VAIGLMGASWSLIALRPTAPAQDTELSFREPQRVESFMAIPTESAEVLVAEAVPAPKRVVYLPMPQLDDKVGTITLPTLGLSWPIFEGTTEAQLSKGVGHYVGSVLPGIRDNSVLSGHRTTVFNRLGELEVGNLIFVRTQAGDFTYRVRSFQIVVRTSREVIVPTDTAVLTLTTCYPFNQIGATTDAFVVSADLVGSRLAGED